MPWPSSERCGIEHDTRAPAPRSASSRMAVPLTPSASKSPKIWIFSPCWIASATRVAPFCISCMANGSGRSASLGAKNGSDSSSPRVFSRPAQAATGSSAASGPFAHPRWRPFTVCFSGSAVSFILKRAAWPTAPLHFLIFPVATLPIPDAVSAIVLTTRHAHCQPVQSFLATGPVHSAMHRCVLLH